MRGLLATVAMVVLASGCGPGQPTPPVTWSWHWRVPVPPTGPDAATVASIVYAGGTVRALKLDLTVVGLADDLAEVRVSTLDRVALQVIRRGQLPADGHVVVDAGARSAVRLAISTPGATAWPTVTVESITVQESPTGPEEGALVVGPGEIIDTVFDATSPARFIRIAQLTGHDVDLLGFGAGETLISEPTSTDYGLSQSTTWAGLDDPTGIAASHQQPRLLRLTAAELTGHTDLRLTWLPVAVTLPPEQGHARLIVREVVDRKLAFPSPTPDEFFGTWFGVDRDGHEEGPRVCVPTAGIPPRVPDVAYDACRVKASIDTQLDKLECTDWNGRGGVARKPLGVRLPAQPVRCYDAHLGTDFGLRGHALAQAKGIDVTAAAAGVVLFADDAHPDDCFFNPFAGGIGCIDVQLKRPFWEELAVRSDHPANWIVVRQDDGLLAYYFHVRTHSITVSPGQVVACGQHLAQVGSAGQSAGPHLHFELRALEARSYVPRDYNEDRKVTTTIDPFPDHWVSWSGDNPPAPTCPSP